jgi:hypothetical protein
MLSGVIFIYDVEIPTKTNVTLFIAGSNMGKCISGQKCTVFTQFAPSTIS